MNISQLNLQLNILYTLKLVPFAGPNFSEPNEIFNETDKEECLLQK